MDNTQDIYRVRFANKDAYRNRVWQILTRDYFQRFVGESDNVLDLGAGYCEFINNIKCGKKYAMDLNPDTRAHAGSDVEVFIQDSSQLWPLKEKSLDVVFTSNFFEHLPDKSTLSRTLDTIGGYLKPGGLLIAMGPNIKYLPGVYWEFWDHYVPLTEYALSETLTHKGFAIELCLDKFLPYTMVGKPEYPAFFTSLYLRLPLAWRIFGKQFLIVARKLD